MGLFVLLILFTVTACQSVAPRSPTGSTQSLHPNQITIGAPPQPATVTGSQRWEYAWNKAMDGVAVGAIAGGPYGVGGGFIIGLVAGLFMADSHYNSIQNQIYSEQQRNLQLEAAIEQELARQSELKKQIFTSIDPTTKPADPQPSVEISGSGTRRPSAPMPETATIKRSAESVILATVNNPEADRGLPTAIKNVEAKDVNGDGIPDLWVYYNPENPDEILREEEASNFDGRVNVWNYFKNKQLIRREVDSKNRGRPDTVFHYVDDKIAREERDETGAGISTYRATFENGRLARVEKETSGDGRTDWWIFYDTTKDGEIILKEERDLDGDGIVDVWSYYDKGLLVRRDVTAAGLKVLSSQEQLPAMATELKRF